MVVVYAELTVVGNVKAYIYHAFTFMTLLYDWQAEQPVWKHMSGEFTAFKRYKRNEKKTGKQMSYYVVF